MTVDEIKVFRYLNTFGTRSHGKPDLLECFQRANVRIVVRDLDGLNHFSVFNEPEKMMCFFDQSLSDAEFTRAGFGSFVFYLIGGRGATFDATGDAARAEIRQRSELLVKQIIAPNWRQKRKDAAVKFNPPRRHHHIAGLPHPNGF